MFAADFKSVIMRRSFRKKIQWVRVTLNFDLSVRKWESQLRARVEIFPLNSTTFHSELADQNGTDRRTDGGTDAAIP